MQKQGTLAGILALALVWHGCTRQQTEAGPAQPGSRAIVGNFATPWQDEAQYIVTIVASDLAEMAYYAREKKPLPARAGPPVVRATEVPGANPLTYRVAITLPGHPEINCDLPMTTAIWAPATYRPLTRQLFEQLQLSGSAAAVPRGEDLVSILAEPKPELLAQVDRKQSGELDDAFTAAWAHENAALLLATFALREAPGDFFQIRVELSRLAAHLAFAEALRGERQPTAAGRIAAVALAALYNDQTGALALLEAVPEDADARVWKRALRMRITQDYRLLANEKKPTLLEKIEWFRAYAGAVHVDEAWAKLEVPEGWRQTDWARVANAYKPAVEVGHQLLRLGWSGEQEEISRVHAIEEERELTKDTLVSELNAEPQRCVAERGAGRPPVRILGWGLWAAFLQRHLCHTVTADFRFMERTWGVPAEAAKYRDGVDGFLWKLDLYPFVRRQNATEAGYYRKAQDEEMALVRRRPHLVPARSWNIINYEVDFAALYLPPPHPFINEWHLHNPPPGTAYDIFPRMNHPSLLSMNNRVEMVRRLEELHARAPYDGIICHNLLRLRDGEQATAAQIAEVYGPLVEYSVHPAARLARLPGLDDGTREKWLRKWAEFMPSGHYHLGEFQLKAGREAEAAASYQRWADAEWDDVAVSNSIEWLVKYYERTGRPDRATPLADRAAETYSARGLLLKADLLEKRGDLDGALALHEKQAERYDDPGPLAGFLARRRTDPASDSKYERQLRKILANELPDGLETFQPGAGSPPPEQGVAVHAEPDLVEKAGLKRGDVIVAVRGYRVSGWEAFKLIRSFENTPYSLIVWRRGKYQKIGPLPASYRFGVDLPDYRKN